MFTFENFPLIIILILTVFQFRILRTEWEY